MIDTSGLRERVEIHTEPWTISRAQMLELLDEVERLQGVDRDVDKLHARYKERVAELERQNTDLQRRNTKLVERNRQLEAAVIQLNDLVRCNCVIHSLGANCSARRADAVVKALKEKAE